MESVVEAHNNGFPTKPCILAVRLLPGDIITAKRCSRLEICREGGCGILSNASSSSNGALKGGFGSCCGARSLAD